MFSNFQFSRTHIFLIIVIIMFVLFLIKAFAPIDQKDKTFKVTVTKNRTTIMNLDETPEPVSTKTFYTDTINYFSADDELTHVIYGPTGIAGEFYMEIEGKINVNKSQNYYFKINFDDGYRLTIDNILVGEFTEVSRGNIVEESIYLSEGQHEINVKYFESYGPTALIIEYFSDDDERPVIMGINTRNIEFLKFF